LKLESRNSEEIKRVYELDVYKLTEALLDRVWHGFDKWNKSWKTLSKIKNQSRKPERTKTRKKN